MPRNRNTDSRGGAFSKEVIIAVWQKATPVIEFDASKKRKDVCNAWIEFDQYGVTVENGTGWGIDHIKPVAAGGTDALTNLQPLQWQNNRHKSDNIQWSCLVSATN